MKIIRKFLLAFLLSVILVVAIGITAYKEINVTKEEFNVLKEERLKELKVMDDIVVTVYKEHSMLATYLITNDPSLLKDIEVFHAQVKESLTEFEKIPGGAANTYDLDVAEMKSKLDETYILESRIIKIQSQMMEIDEPDEVQRLKTLEDLILREHLKKSSDISLILDGLTYFVDEKLDKATQKMDKRVDDSISKIFYFTILMAIFNITLGVLLSTSITNPINKLRGFAESIRNGNLDVVVDIKSNDEISDLGRSFEAMAKELKRSYETLEQKVEERTNEIEETKGYLAGIIEGSADAIMSIDLNGIIKSWNRGAKQMLGYRKSEIIGKHYYILVPRRHRREIERIRDEAFEKGFVRNYETYRRHKDGRELPVNLTITPIKTREGKIIGTSGILKDITERKRAEDELLRKFLRYRVEKGEVYLIKEQNPDLSIEVFKDILSCGFSGTVFSRAKKEEIEEALGKVKSFWLAENAKTKDAIKPRFSDIESRIKAIGAAENNTVLLERMDYLISKNGFDATLKFVQRLSEQAYLQRLIVIMALDPQTLRPLELRRLEKETKRVEPKVKSRLPEDIYEILKFVYSENRVGVYPSYKDIYEKFKITRTTARSRIKRLKAMEFLVDRKRGRTKILEITDKGQDQF